MGQDVIPFVAHKPNLIFDPGLRKRNKKALKTAVLNAGLNVISMAEFRLAKDQKTAPRN